MVSLSGAIDLSTRLTTEGLREQLVIRRERACVLLPGKLPRRPGSIIGFSRPVKCKPRLLKPPPNRLVLHALRDALFRGARNRLAPDRPSDLRCGQRELQHAWFEFIRCDAAEGSRAGVCNRRCLPSAVSLRRLPA